MKIFFLCFCAFLWSGLVQAETLIYHASGAGMPLMDITVDNTVTSQDYRAKMTTETRGLLSLFVDSQAVFNSRGFWRDDFPVVVTSDMRTENGDEIKKRVLDFSEREGQLDYASVFLHQVMTQSPETKDYTVFDGKRKLLITFRYQGEVSGLTVDCPPYPTLQYYTVTVDILEGKKKGWFFNRMKDKQAPPLHLYFTPPNESSGQRKLACATFDTALFGRITIREK